MHSSGQRHCEPIIISCIDCYMHRCFARTMFELYDRTIKIIRICVTRCTYQTNTPLSYLVWNWNPTAMCHCFLRIRFRWYTVFASCTLVNHQINSSCTMHIIDRHNICSTIILHAMKINQTKWWTTICAIIMLSSVVDEKYWRISMKGFGNYLSNSNRCSKFYICAGIYSSSEFRIESLNSKAKIQTINEIL